MTPARSLRLWRTALVVCAVVLYAIALSRDAYELTSPAALSWHVLLRKTYSIGAFGLLAFLLRRSRIQGSETTVPIALAIALYSTAIEIGQYLTGVREGLTSNCIDIACGFIGGVLGAIVARFI